MAEKVCVLDYGAGNVRSLRNAIKALGYQTVDIASVQDIQEAKAIIFPGVGTCGQAMQSLKSKGWFDALREYLLAGRPFFGICIGMQSLFEGSEESPDDGGLGIIPSKVTRFDTKAGTVRVPQIGWNALTTVKPSAVLENVVQGDTVYFVHSFCALPTEANADWISTVTDYGGQRYISMVQKGNVVATQFHPEKSGKVGLNILGSFLAKQGNLVPKMAVENALPITLTDVLDYEKYPRTQPVKRVIACLDVRSNDAGDLVVTKGDQYDVREAATEGEKGGVRNLGKPVSLCERYYSDGADEVVFLNITSFRQGVIEDMPMLAVLEKSSENVFVPLCVGGGIREYTDAEGKVYTALDVASRYFRAGADKISIGSDAVFASEAYLASGVKTGSSSMELISEHYGAQAVVVSVDPKRVYVSDPAAAPGKHVMPLLEGETGPNGEKFCWWQTTVKGGREMRDLCAVALARCCEALGAGEIMLNCIDMDGQGKGYDLQLIRAVQASVTVPVIASSGAGAVTHFSQVYRETDVAAALAAGIFHRNEVRIGDVKSHLISEGIPARN